MKSKRHIDKRQAHVSGIWRAMLVAACVFTIAMFSSQAWILAIPAAILVLGSTALYFYPHFSEWLRSSTPKDVDQYAKYLTKKEIPCLEELELARLDQHLAQRALLKKSL